MKGGGNYTTGGNGPTCRQAKRNTHRKIHADRRYAHTNRTLSAQVNK